MIYDIGSSIAEYCNWNNYYYLMDFPSGANQSLDQFLNEGNQIGVYYNILETGQLTRISDREIVSNRTVEITVFEKSDTKEDKGNKYYTKILTTVSIAQDIFKHLAKECGVSSARIDTGVDQMDATLVIAKLTVTTQEEIQIC